MPMITPSIDQAALLKFQQNFHMLAQQTDSNLAGSGAILYLPSDGKTNNLARMNGFELNEVTGRNPLKNYEDYETDNRMFRKRRFNKTILIDAKDDINELLADPTSYLVQNMLAAKNRVFDRVICSAAVGDVLVGKPDGTPTSVTATADGMRTIDATGGVTYSTVQKVTQTFINNSMQLQDLTGSQFLITGKENTELMDEDKFIKNDYIDGRPVQDGTPKRTGIYGTVLFAGSETGGITVPAPILPETATERTCLVLTPKSIACAMHLDLLEVKKSDAHVNSWAVNIDLWINAMRIEGERVVAIKTTK